jgi:undecaprenyl-diphosphatase
LALAALVAGVAAYTCIALFLRVFDRIGLMPFVWYRLALGSVLVVMAW